MIIVIFIFESPFHIKFVIFYTYFFINHMFRDIHGLDY
jgi:hypothetical protein